MSRFVKIRDVRWILLSQCPLLFCSPFKLFPKSAFSLCWCLWGMAVKAMWELKVGSSCLGWGTLWPEYGNVVSTGWVLRYIKPSRWFQPPPTLADHCVWELPPFLALIANTPREPCMGKENKLLPKFSIKKCMGRHHRKVFAALVYNKVKR